MIVNVHMVVLVLIFSPDLKLPGVSTKLNVTYVSKLPVCPYTRDMHNRYIIEYGARILGG